MDIADCRSKSGYTLIEVLVVTGILAVVLTVIAACLAGGIRVWGAARIYGQLESAVLLDMAFLEKDLMRATPFFGVNCRGSGEQLEFPALLRQPQSLDGGQSQGLDSIGTIRYSFNRERGALLKKQWTFPHAEPSDEAAEEMLSGLEECHIEYASFPNGANGLRAAEGIGWSSAWNVATNLPVGIRLELAVKRAGESMRFRKTVFLPIRSDDLRAGE